MFHTPTESKSTVRIFIGSSSKNVVEEKVFVYSLQKYSSLPIEVNILSGDTGSVRMHNGEVKELPASVRDRLKGATAFSLARFAIPYWCNYEGRAIYCDSDQLSLVDIAELWNYELSGTGAAAVHVRDSKSGKYYVNSFLKQLIDSGADYYLTSVMLMDCVKLKSWNLESIVQQFNQKQFSYSEMMFLGQAFTQQVATEVTRLSPEWNHLDVLTRESKLVHFTDLTSQPWLFDHNPIGAFWEQFYLAAVEQDFVSQSDISQAFQNGGISPRIKNLPTMRGAVGQSYNTIVRTWNAATFRLRSVLRSEIILAKLKQAMS